MFDKPEDVANLLSLIRQNSELHRRRNVSSSGSTWAGLGNLLAPIQWDWPGWLPRGFLTLLASKPGAGKSTLCLHLAATYLSGRPWPNGAAFNADRGKVLWCESEASHALNLERARNWGLDLARILSPLDNPLHNFRLDNRRHYAALLKFARRDDVRLVILDSLGGLRSQGSNALPIGNFVFALADLARIAGKPVLLTHHFRKRTGHHGGLPSDLDRLLGAAAITQAAHVIWALDTPDPAEPEHRRLSVMKNNLLQHPFTLQFLQKTAQAGPSLPLHFGPAPQEPSRSPERDRALDFLRRLLADGPLPATRVKSEYEAAGFSRATIDRAKQHLGINSFRPQGKHAWYWELPS
jgi:putative DNA primase/helicase